MQFANVMHSSGLKPLLGRINRFLKRRVEDKVQLLAAVDLLDVLDIIAPIEVREKMSTQLKNIDFTSHPAAADPVTLRAVQKAIALIELKFTPQGESH